MTLPVLTLLGFAAWTLILLLLTVGVYRWTRIFAGRDPISEFSTYKLEGADWYCRAMRAHANCIENLPVFGVIVFSLYVTGIDGQVVNFLAVSVLAARVAQSLVHVCFVQTEAVASFRFAFFFVQFVSFVVLIVIVLRHALPQT